MPWHGADPMRGVTAFGLAAIWATNAESAEPWLAIPPNATVTIQAEAAPGLYRLPVAAYVADGPASERVLEGMIQRRVHEYPAKDIDTRSAIARYRALFAENAFEEVFYCEAATCGGFYFRFAADIAPPPEMRIDVNTFAQLSVKDPAGTTHVSVLVSQVLDRIYVQTTIVGSAVEGEPLPAMAVPDTTTATSPESETLLAALLRNGRVVIPDIAFRTGGTDLTAESSTGIDLAAEALRERDDLKVMIVGHSDNTGDLDTNIELSQRRAESVVKLLVDAGLAEDRFDARGIGFLSPITTNETPEGRLRNRRVEIVVR